MKGKMVDTSQRSWQSAVITMACLVWATQSIAHEPTGHGAPTYEVTDPIALGKNQHRLRLEIVDSATKRPIPARFSLELDGAPFSPVALDRHGLRFTSIHQRANQRYTALYSRGTGALKIPVPHAAHGGVVYVVKGYEYLPEKVPFDISRGGADVRVELSRWSDISKKGWHATDEHLHFDRSDPRHNSDWLTLLAGDGLASGHFLILKGGNIDGTWAKQYAYGTAGEAYDGLHLARSGEEFRDTAQGHINLLGINRVIQPISIGGIGMPPVKESYPPFVDVFRQTRDSGGIGGHAHGGTLGRSATAELDAVLGMTDFIEIANAFLTELELWYHLMNCGFNLPPVAGTDLPNFPYRNWWQPLLGEVRMYLRVGEDRSFDAWTTALRRGEVFVTSGPMVQFTVNGVGPGGVVRLPEGGGEVEVIASLASPRPLEELRVVRNGQPIAATVQQKRDGPIHYIRVHQRISIGQSSWLAAYGIGEVNEALREKSGVVLPTFAHTAALRILVGDRAIRVPQDIARLGEKLKKQRAFYQTEVSLANEDQKEHFKRLFDQALSKVEGMARSLE